MKCRNCKTELKYTFLDLGKMPLANSFIEIKNINDEEVNFPLEILVCEKCKLVQTKDFVNAREIFDKEYIYYSSFSTSWIEHARKYSIEMIERFDLSDKSFVIEIASNDGYLLQNFVENKIPCLGIEPAKYAAEAAKLKGIKSETEYFDFAFSKQVVKNYSKADLIICNNVLAHVPNINDFIKGIKNILKSDGVATFEFPHLLELVKNIQFDTIYHEHFSYLSFTTVIEILRKNELEIFDVKKLSTHGGSLRLFVKHQYKELDISASVSELIYEEIEAGIKDLEFYKNFQKKVQETSENLVSTIKEIKGRGEKIAAYGAAAKGNTLLNYCKIKNNVIDYCLDKSTVKQNKYLPGSKIRVHPVDYLFNKKPDYLLILPWNLKGEIIEELKCKVNWKMKYIIPIPKVEIIDE